MQWKTWKKTLLIIAVPISALALVLFRFIGPSQSPDKMVTSVAVPLVISYIMVRLIIRLASALPEPSPTELQIVHEAGKTATSVKLTPLITVLAIGFMIGIWVAVCGILSAGVFLMLEMSVELAVVIAGMKWVFTGVALAAVAICLTSLCKLFLMIVGKWFHELFNNPSSLLHGPT